MRAMVITRPGGPEVLEPRDVPVPEPARGEVRVRVRATAVNRADILQRMGRYPAPPDSPADIPGLEFAGEIDALGEALGGDWKVGDRVFGLVGGGAYAEAIVTHCQAIARIPDRLSFEEAAAVPEAFVTAYDALVTQAHLGGGDWVLIHAVGGGVGTAAVQIARAVGAQVLGTSRSQVKLDRARPLGLDHGILTTGAVFAGAALSRTRGAGVDVVLDLIGGDYLAEDIACAAPRAHIIVAGLLAGARTDIDLGAVLSKRLTLIGTVLRTRAQEEKIQAMRVFARDVVPLLAGGDVRPVVYRTFPLSDVGKAHIYVANNEGFGKVVLTL
ncbi:MAG: NAD(P)H-quinone oxidoreductase [Pseudomonadota bacterium]